jgi:hypothetical protein
MACLRLFLFFKKLALFDLSRYVSPMIPLRPIAGRAVLLSSVLTSVCLPFCEAQVLDFDVTSEGPWSDIDRTTLTVPMVPNGSIILDGKPSSSEYGGFEGVPVIPGENAWILNFPGDRDWTDVNDSSFTFWLAHDQDYFYVATEVKDDILNSDDPNPQLWKDDSIEIVVDALNDRYDNNTDNSNDPYGGHSYFSYEGKFSVWDEEAGGRGEGRWSTAVDFTYGDGEDVWAVGQQGNGGWQLEVRFHKRLFEDPEVGNKLQDGYRMGFNIGVDDDDKTGPGANGSGIRSQDLELQYFWANRARLKGWNAEEADWYTDQEIADRVYEGHFDRVIDAAGRLAHGGTGEIIFAALSTDTGGGNQGGDNGSGNQGGGGPTIDQSPDLSLDPTKTQMALPLPQAPVIDGVLDPAEGWAFAGGAAQNFWSVRYDEALDDLLRGGGFGDGTPDEIWDETDIQFNMYAGVFENDLYVAVEVTDDWVVNDTAEANSEDGSTWEDDSVEIFIDGDNSNFEERNTAGIPEIVDTGGQFVITTNNARRDKEAGDPSFGDNADWYARTDLTDNGYVAEFRISLDAIGNPQPGQVIGFTVGINDDDEISKRQLTWVGTPHTESTYGNLFIGERTYTAPKTASPTLDGVVHADEYEGALPIVLNGHTGSYHIGVGNDEWEEGDHSLTGWVVHDEDSIYVAVIAQDDVISTDTAEAGSEDGQTWVDDSIEVFFDADDSNDATRDDTAQFEGQFVLTPNGARRDNEANNPTWGENADWFAATTAADGGYQMEFKFSKAALLGVSEGDRLGFNIALNDDDGAGRKSQLNWAGSPHMEFSYGALLLGGAASGGGGGGGAANVSLMRSGNAIVLEWEGGGSLHTAPAITGPWSEVSGASSGVQIEASTGEAYYRVR